MSDISPLVYQIGGAGALALLIIKEVRHWTTSLYNRRNGHHDNGDSKQGERISANETNITNMKDSFKEQRKENKAEHISMKQENKDEHEIMEDKNRLAHAAMTSANKKAHDEIKALIINGGSKKN